MSDKKLYITETILRDAHQSQAATRMRIEDMLPVLGKLDKVGYFSVECWGGATFDSCLRFLNEDPWERLRTIKRNMPNTKLQMLLRGQNLLGYKHYADDVVERFVRKSLDNGIEIMRIFDALNDVRNMRTAIESTKRGGGTVEAAFSYTTSPVHSLEYFVDISRRLVDMGADIICIKDMANLLLPYKAYELVSAIKRELGDIPVHLHTHNTTGVGSMTYLKAVEAGVDIVDTALSPMANGTSQPGTESLVATLRGTERDTGLDLNLLSEISAHFRTVAERLKAEGVLNPKVLNVDVNALLYQIPGGMMSNLINQLKEQGASDKYQAVLAEVPRVRKDMGYPPLVTPTSQIVGTQAVLNVTLGERYKLVTKETKGLLRGEYGKLPADPDPEIVKKCIGDAERIECRPADLLEPEYAEYKTAASRFSDKEEDVLSYCLFPQIAEKFFKAREESHKRTLSVKIDDKKYIVEISDADYVAPERKPAPAASKPEPPAARPNPRPEPAPTRDGTSVYAPMPGTVLRLCLKDGAKAKAGQALLVLEAMKMENDIVSPCDGIVRYEIAAGSTVETRTLLAVVL